MHLLGNMQYVTENQFELLRKVLWTSAIHSMKVYDAEFWRDVIRHGRTGSISTCSAFMIPSEYGAAVSTANLAATSHSSRVTICGALFVS
eukprot:2282028-Amphidinium_carterae.3